MHLQHRRIASIHAAGWAVWALAAASALSPGIALAQVPDVSTAEPPGFAPVQLPVVATEPADAAVRQRDNAPAAPRQSGVWLEPRITVQHTVTNNARLDATHVSDQVTEVNPGFRLVSDTARINGFVDYSLRTAHYARGTASDQVWHNLNARGTAEAIENRVFVDVAGVVALQPISAFAWR